jgi:hypothetical protein
MTEDGKNAIIHVFNNCWFSSYEPRFEANNFILSETANLLCEYVTTTKDSISAVYGGLRGISFDYDIMERNTDTKGIRGRYAKTNIGNII